MHDSGPDRMDNPLSSTAAIVGGIAFIVLVGCLSALLSDRTLLRSPRWWDATVLATCVLVTSILGYFRPNTRAIYLPVFLGGLMSFGLCLWAAWFLLNDPQKGAIGFLQASGWFVAWCGWAANTFRQLRDRS
jgi:hypothetical protein